MLVINYENILTGFFMTNYDRLDTLFLYTRKYGLKLNVLIFLSHPLSKEDFISYIYSVTLGQYKGTLQVLAPLSAGAPANVDVCIYYSAAAKTRQNLTRLHMLEL